MRQKIQNSLFNQENKVVQYDHHITFSVIMLVILIFSYIQISAQDGKRNKINDKSISDKINSTAVTGDVINFKDESNNSLIKITDEGNAGSIELPNVGSILSGNKLYNNGGGLFWGSSAIGTGASDINSLSDAKYDGSSIFLGFDAGINDDGTNANTAIGKSALNQNTVGTANTAVGWEVLSFNTIGFDNTAIGHVSLHLNVDGKHNTAIGTNVMYSNTIGNYNTAVGLSSLMNNIAGSNGVAIGYESQRNSNKTSTAFINYNTSVGYQSLYGGPNFFSNTGNYNTTIGYQSLFSNVSGNYNTASGYQSLTNNTSGDNNTSIGYSALSNNTTGDNNTANGAGALYSNTSGNFNTANGYSSLYTNETGFANTANGYNALLLNINGDYNTANGSDALYSNAAGNSNTAIGSIALQFNTIGNSNTAIGVGALNRNTIGTNNVGVGMHANSNNLEGSYNTIIGYEAGKGTSTHNKSGNVFIGYRAGYSETNDNRLYIENSSADSALIWGNFNNRRVVINGNGDDGNTTFTFYVNGKSGGSTSWNNLSDERLKKNISTIPNALDKVKNLRGVNYEWKDPKKYENGLQMGFIAQEANEVIPEVVDDSGEYYSMQYAPITALLVEAIKDQQKIIENLKVENSELDARFSKIENYLKGKSLVNINN